MEARLVFLDSQGRPRVIAEALLHRGGAIGLFLRVLDREGAPRLVGAAFVRRDGTGELAVVVLDRHGTARAVSAIVLHEDGTAVFFVGFDRAGVRRLVVVITTGPAGRTPAALTQAEPDTNPNHGGALLLPVEDLSLAGWLARLMIGDAVVRLDAPLWFPLIDPAILRHDTPPQFQQMGAAFVVDDVLLRFLFLAAAAVGNGGLRLLPVPAAALGVDGLLVFLSAAAVDRLVGAISVHEDGTGDFVVVELDRRSTARASLARLLREDGALVVFVGIEPAGARRVFVITNGRPTAFPSADVHQHLLPLRGAELALARHTTNSNRGGGLLRAELTLDGWVLRLPRTAAAGFDGRRLLPLAAAAPGVDELLGFLAAPADDFDWPRRFWLIDAALAGLGAAPRFLPLPAAAPRINEPPRLLHAPAVAAHVDGPRLLPLPAEPDLEAFLAAQEFGVDRPLLPPFPGAPLVVDRLQLPIPAAPGNGVFPSIPNAMDDHRLEMLEAGRRLGPSEDDQVLPSDTTNLLDMIFHLQEEMQRAPDNIDESAVTEAAIALFTEMLNHMSERARNQIISNQTLTFNSSRTSEALAEHSSSAAERPQEQQNIEGRMRRSFFWTVGISVASNTILYFLSLGLRVLEQSEEGRTQCAQPPSSEPQNDARDKWVMKFLGWLLERIAAPVLLTSLVVWVRESVISSEIPMMQYDNNETANILINGLSRAVFLAVRGFPGLGQPNLWARLACTLIDFVGAAFLYWMGGFWDPDMADGT